MPKDEWGVKRVCPSCNIRFYDLQKDPLHCPNCNSEFSLESLLSDKPKIEKAAEAPKEPAAEPVIDEEADVLDVEADIDVDDDLLDDDDDDEVSLEEIADVPTDDDDS